MSNAVNGRTHFQHCRITSWATASAAPPDSTSAAVTLRPSLGTLSPHGPSSNRFPARPWGINSQLVKPPWRRSEHRRTQNFLCSNGMPPRRQRGWRARCWGARCFREQEMPEVSDRGGGRVAAHRAVSARGAGGRDKCHMWACCQHTGDLPWCAPSQTLLLSAGARVTSPKSSEAAAQSGVLFHAAPRY